jgi:hypothetical protein
MDWSDPVARQDPGDVRSAMPLEYVAGAQKAQSRFFSASRATFIGGYIFDEVASSQDSHATKAAPFGPQLFREWQDMAFDTDNGPYYKVSDSGWPGRNRRLAFWRTIFADQHISKIWIDD